MQNVDYPVRCTSGKTRLQSELKAAFDLVAPKPNWKMPIAATIYATTEKSLVSDAIIHFTGSVPTFASQSGKRYRVKAAGYYASVGA